MLRPYGITHVEITVSDLDRSLKFYRDLLGLHEAPPPDGVEMEEGLGADAFDLDGTNEHPSRQVKFAVLRYDDSVTGAFAPGYEPCGIVLIEPINPPPSGKAIKVDQIGISHISLLMTGDIDELRQRMNAAGVNIVGGTISQDRAHPSKSIFVEDPDSILIQIDVLPGTGHVDRLIMATETA